MSICRKLFIGWRNPASTGTIALILWEDLYTINSPQTRPDAHMLMALQAYAQPRIITTGLELIVERSILKTVRAISPPRG